VFFQKNFLACIFNFNKKKKSSFRALFSVFEKFFEKIAQKGLQF